MPQPPSPEHGPPNVVDSDVLAVRRRARHAELGEDAALELRLFDAERRLGEVAAERDALLAKLEDHERSLRSARQREWAEQQQRLEAQGEVAAVRDVAAGQIAALRERLAAAEAELAALGAERDRAREALRAESERRREVERRAALVSEASEAVGVARRRLAEDRRSAVQIRALEQRLVQERRAFAAQVGAVESAVAAVRERLGAAVHGLQELLVAERAARDVAESALAAEREAGRRARMQAAWLDAELARRTDDEAELRAALDGLRQELDAARAGEGAREARLGTRVEAVLAMAARLRDGVERDLTTAGAGLRSEREGLAAALATMEERVTALQAGVAETAALREQLEVERAARWVAEAELNAERRRGDDDRAARAAAEDELAAAQTELDELRAIARPTAPDAASLASLRETLGRLRTTATEPPDTSLAIDLAAAAARLRTATAEPAVVEVAGERVVDAAAPQEGPDVDATAPAVERALRLVPLPARDGVGAGGQWLHDVLLTLAGEAPDIAEQLLVALLPAQKGLARKPLAYELAVVGGGTYRVVLGEQTASVEPATWPAPATRIAGPLAALAPLAAGGAGRRLPGVTVDGRRHVRRLIKGRRATIGLVDVAAAEVVMPPGPLLTALARAVEPRWTAGRPLSVDVVATGADTWRVVASGDGPLKVLPAVATVAPPRATLHTSAARLPAVLAGLAETGEASVEGDLKAVRTLLSWFDRAQRSGR